MTISFNFSVRDEDLILKTALDSFRQTRRPRTFSENISDYPVEI